AGLNFGPTFFLGDLGGNIGKGGMLFKDVNLELTKMMKGAFISIYPADWIGFRLAAQLTHVSGQDYIINSNGITELWRKQRNLDFRSNILEAYTAVELFPTMMFRKKDDYEPRLKPYGFVGIGLFHFNPEGSIQNPDGSLSWHKLHPLKTEGQGMQEYSNKKAYSLTQVNIPMGFGIKYQLSDKVNIATEFLYRKTFTDYIDDVSTTYIDPNYFDQYLTAQQSVIARSIHDKTLGIVTPGLTRYAPGDQRGNSNNNDTYFSTIIKLGVRMGSVYSSDIQKRAARQTKCPHFY
ncbi:MAG: hypothetical protein WD135_06365, partial [Ferruginibacter sp.]